MALHKMKNKTQKVKSKISDDHCKTNCVICWAVLGSKKQLLHGSKCAKYNVKCKLQSILLPEDFNALYDENIFIEPRLCKPCFSTITRIPKCVSKLETFFGKINTKLYKKKENTMTKTQLSQRESSGDCSILCDKSALACVDVSYVQSSPQGNDRDNNVDCAEGEGEDPAIEHVSTGENSEIHLPVRGTQSDCDNNSIGLNDDMNESVTECPRDTENLQSSEDATTKLSPASLFNVGPSGSQNCQLIRKSPRKRPLVKKSNSGASLTQNDNTIQSSLRDRKFCPIKHEYDSVSTVMPNVCFVNTDMSKPLTNKKREAKRSSRRKCNVDESVKHDIEHNEGSVKSTPTSNRRTTSNSLNKVTCINQMEHAGIRKTQRRRKQLVKTVYGQNKVKVVKRTRKDVDGSSLLKKEHKSRAIKSERNFRETGTSVLDDIPSFLSKCSKQKLKDLYKKIGTYMSTKKSTVSMLMIKCSVENCSHKYPLWRHLALHIKYYHNDGKAPAKDDFLQKMSALTDKCIDEETFSFKCRHEGCDLRFSVENKRQEHEGTHDTDMSHICGYPDCGKAFKSLANLQTHHRTHTGERPFLCQVAGCGRAFVHKSDLTMHKRRHRGEKPHACDFKDCGKAFTTSSELSGHKLTHSKDSRYCCDACGRQYSSRKGIRDHRKKIHGVGKPGGYKCTYEGCTQTFHRKDVFELHLCSHSSEQLLCCEKCGKRFGCKRYLDVHYKVHKKNELQAINPAKKNIPCEKEGCEKKFTSRVLMKRHVISVHLGRRPRPIPGVYHACKVEGCGRKFSMRSTLSRHDKLVHKGGDYKLNRIVVRYPCTMEGCGRDFNRKNLLEEHMASVHGKSTRRLQQAQALVQDCMERMCEHCGMALSLTQLPRHLKVYHKANASGEEKEKPPFPCCVKDCGLLFPTLEERRTHVEVHRDNPPYKCEVEDCKEAFHLLKNLDNHLWNHCKKPCMCEFEGCSKQFADQLLLAKHSKVHYEGRMLCSWRNCGLFFTSMGTLKQHLIAHSRSLKANFGSDFMCSYCDRVFSSRHGLNRHMALHDLQTAVVPKDEKSFVCEEEGCQQRFSQERDFSDHFLQHFTNQETVCGFQGCQQHFTTQLMAAKHGKFHYGGKYKCPWDGCEMLFKNFHFLKRHLIRHILFLPAIAADRRFACPKCDLTFKVESNLSCHMKKHIERSEYVCPECGKKFHHNHLKRHMLIHMQEKAHVCNLCGVRYGTVNGLRFHTLKIHKVGKWPLKCSYCNKGFISGSELRRHLPSHTKEKPYACSVCSAPFATHTGLKGHMRKHTGEKFVCEVEGCGKVYNSPLSMRGHRAQHAGFSKTCQHCGKTYRNPYGHKCKASLMVRRKQLPSQEDSQSMVSSTPMDSSPLTRTVTSSQLHREPAALPPQSVMQSPPQQLMQPSAMQSAVLAAPSLRLSQQALSSKLLPPPPLPPPPPSSMMSQHSSLFTQLPPPALAQPPPSVLSHHPTQPVFLMQPDVQRTQRSYLMPDMPVHNLDQHGPASHPETTAQIRGHHTSTMDMPHSVDMSTDCTFNNYVVFWDSQTNT